MDNITHTLVGACLAEAGLKQRTALGAATLMIGANFPDIDVVAVPLGMGIEWRRGATHGFLALLILPFVLAGIMWLWDRRVRRRRLPAAPAADYRRLAILSAIAIATHPTLDFMNTYGMRWLMPFSDRPFYADGLFIVDLWLFLALLVGVLWSRRSESVRPARFALGAVAIYTTAMLVITGVGRTRVAAEYPGRRFMVQPNAVIPWSRDVLLEVDRGYVPGRYRLFGDPQMGNMRWPKVALGGIMVRDGSTDSLLVRARSVPKVQAFLRWARFPMYNFVPEGGRTLVWVSDARYDGAGWATVEVTLP